MSIRSLTACALLSLGTLLPLSAETVWLSSLDLNKMQQEWGFPKRDQSMGGKPLSIHGTPFAKGVGTHASSYVLVDLKGTTDRFTAQVGLDDETAGEPQSPVEFLLYGDGKLLWKSGPCSKGTAPIPVDVPLGGVHALALCIDPVGKEVTGSHADWADARFETSGTAPETTLIPAGPAVVLTPPSGPTARLHGPKVFGVRPGAPFLYTISATGDRPMSFSADGLPAGLKLDPATGGISGSLPAAGEYSVTLHASNAAGKDDRALRIVVGEKITLTPPMGWNSWNCWGGSVSQEKVLGSAQALVSRGLRDHGWSYVNVDDGWQGNRGGPLNAIQPNAKFPDIQGLADQIHGMGLRFGVYSTPWRGSYQGHVGSYSDNADGTYDWIASGDHNEFFRIGKDPATWDAKRRSNYRIGRYSFVDADARQWAQWGVDYLKYDWYACEAEHATPMAKALRASGRDIALSLSNATVLSDAKAVAGVAQAWRTSGDITDTWRSVESIAFRQASWTPYSGPGHWNDPDMLVVGQVGWGHPHPTRLTPDEQYTHISMWCLLSAPLLIGCDLVALDDFTLSLLTNDEVLDVDQDPLGRQAVAVARQGQGNAYAKPLEDGSWAVGLFNRGPVPAEVGVKWDDLHLSGSHAVRDLWRQKDLGTFPTGFSGTIPPHGVMLVRVSPSS